MKSGFKDPTVIKNQRPKDSPQGPGKQWPWDWKCPQYDERSSCFINAGTHYGVGHNQPVGHHGEPKQRVDTMPFGRPNTMRVDEAG
jgi:hypothetical protein